MREARQHVAAGPSHNNSSSMRAIPRAELVWVQAPSGFTPGAALPFPDQPTLNGVYIVGVEAYDASDLTNTPDLVPVIANVIDWTLTLNEGSDARFREMPCSSLNTLTNFGVYKEFLPVCIDWQKSRVKYVGGGALASAFSAPFLFMYFRPEDISKYGIDISRSW